MIHKLVAARRPPTGSTRTNVDKLTWSFVAILLGASAFYVLWPLRELVRQANDFAFVYTAGRAWAHGFSPYDIPRWHAEWASVIPSWANGEPPPGPYVYPPHWAILAAPLGLLPWPIACRIWDLVNVASYVALSCLVVLFVRRLSPKLPSALVWAFVALAGFNSAVRWCIFECQLSLLPLLGVCGAFWAHHEKRSGWLVLFAFVASLKPQISCLPLLFLLLDGSHRQLLKACFLAIAIGVIAMIPSGLRAFPTQFVHAYNLHLDMKFMQPSEFYNVSPLLAAVSANSLPLFSAPLLGGVLVVTLVSVKRHLASTTRNHPLFDPLWQLGLLAALEVAFTPQHGYDLVMYTPVVVLAAAFQRRWLSGLVVLLIMIESRALAMAERLQVGPVAPYGSLLIAVLCVLALIYAARSGGRDRPSSLSPLQSAVRGGHPHGPCPRPWRSWVARSAPGRQRTGPTCRCGAIFHRALHWSGARDGRSSAAP